MSGNASLQARVRRRHRASQGLTLIELLLSLAILAALTSFLAGGLSSGRRSFDRDRASMAASEADVSIQALAKLVSSALPLREAAGKAQILFSGGPDTLQFVALSEGRAQRGGPVRAILRREGNDLVAELAAVGAGETIQPSSRVVILRGIKEVRFVYFGRLGQATQPAWRASWAQAETLPRLVSIEVSFLNSRQDRPSTIVALRQG